jgi:cytoskeletal protein CcmA (bactofilin family)
MVISPGSTIADSITRSGNRLYICSRGNLTLGSTARLSGLISVISSDSIVIESGASITGCVLVAMRGLRAGGADLSSVQLISPQIALGPGCLATYPSIALSVPLDPRSPASQRLLIAKGVSFEGFLAIVSARGDDVLEIEAGSRLTGAVYSSARLTLDGDLYGSALAHDLYFYEAPTSYLGWKRRGTIDRQKLPEGFLIAPIFGGKHEISVNEWK